MYGLSIVKRITGNNRHRMRPARSDEITAFPPKHHRIHEDPLVRTRIYGAAVMTRDITSIKSIVRSVRFSPTFSELIEAECHARKVSLSEYVRQSEMANMRYMRRQAMEDNVQNLSHFRE
jgi:hypothetical protein